MKKNHSIIYFNVFWLQFRKAVQDVTQPHHDDNFLLRWLRGKNFCNLL